MKRDKKTVYHVITPEGRVANNHGHVSELSANRHQKLLEIFYANSYRE